MDFLIGLFCATICYSNASVVGNVFFIYFYSVLCKSHQNSIRFCNETQNKRSEMWSQHTHTQTRDNHSYCWIVWFRLYFNHHISFLCGIVYCHVYISVKNSKFLTKNLMSAYQRLICAISIIFKMSEPNEP